MTSARLQGPPDGGVPASFCVLGLGDEVHWVSLALMHALRGKGFRVTGLLPRADDVYWDRGRWRSERVLQLQGAGSFAFPVSALCPSVQGGLAGGSVPPVDVEAVVDSCAALATWVDLVVVDALGLPDGRSGCDGGEADDMTDVAQALGLPVVIACEDSEPGLRDACRLVARLRGRGLRVVAWVQSGLTPMACAAGLGCVGAIPADVLGDPAQAARHVDVARLIGLLLPDMGDQGSAASANAHKTASRAS